MPGITRCWDEVSGLSGILTNTWDIGFFEVQYRGGNRGSLTRSTRSPLFPVGGDPRA